MASFKSVFFLLVILAAGGILLVVGETTGPAGDNDLLPTVITNNDTFELEMVCLYKHWLKHHGERTDYTLIEFELDPRFLLFKSYLEHLPVGKFNSMTCFNFICFQKKVQNLVYKN